MDVVPRHAGFQRFMRPERRSGDAVNWVDLTGNLIAFASAGSDPSWSKHDGFDKRLQH